MDTITLLDAFDYYTKIHSKERALWHYLKANEKAITGLIEADPTGYWFHKAFRQIDVTDNGNLDMVGWLLLSEAELFWRMLKQINSGKLIIQKDTINTVQMWQLLCSKKLRTRCTRQTLNYISH